MRIPSIVLLCSLCFVFSSCASYTPSPEGTPTLTLSAAEKRVSGLGLHITFPAGDYTPDFASKDGVYYLAPGSLMFRQLGISSVGRGGVFIPSTAASSQTQLAWAEVSSASVVVALVKSGKSVYTYPLDQPLVFLQVPNQPGRRTSVGAVR